jgi:hypothetical protein
LVRVPALRGADPEGPDGLSKLFKPVFEVGDASGFPGLTGLLDGLKECLLQFRMILTEAAIPGMTDWLRFWIPAAAERVGGVFNLRFRSWKTGLFHPYNEGDDSFLFIGQGSWALCRPHRIRIL